MFRAVLCLVPGLFYVKCLEKNNVPRVPRLFARVYKRTAPAYFYVRI